MKILRVSFSPRGGASESARLSQSIVNRLIQRSPAATVIDRDFGSGPVSHIDANYATHLATARSVTSPPYEVGSLGESERLIKELEDSECVVIGTPMHNFTVPSSLKVWIDHIVRVNRTFNVTSEGKVGTLSDRPVYVAVSSGGRYTGERDRQPDFLTPYLRSVLKTIGMHSVTFFSIQGLACGPDAAAEARRSADLAVAEYFSEVAAE
ncbi:FMN-dependent NADH-azoreductase [Burkholderia sp. GAS332]|jgi:FMN-dependent NADH-azoreductase|nr:FMN-dependent NADH-azoreductase [Burkholderia sp. GAS332]